jgi:hypothetical protein
MKKLIVKPKPQIELKLGEEVDWNGGQWKVSDIQDSKIYLTSLLPCAIQVEISLVANELSCWTSTVRVKCILDKTIHDLFLTKTINVLLKTVNVNTVEELVKMDYFTLYKINYMGKGTLQKMIKKLAEHDLSLGMSEQEIEDYRQSHTGDLK